MGRRRFGPRAQRGLVSDVARIASTCSAGAPCSRVAASRSTVDTGGGRFRSEAAIVPLQGPALALPGAHHAPDSGHDHRFGAEPARSGRCGAQPTIMTAEPDPAARTWPSVAGKPAPATSPRPGSASRGPTAPSAPRTPPRYGPSRGRAGHACRALPVCQPSCQSGDRSAAGTAPADSCALRCGDATITAVRWRQRLDG